MDYRYEKIDKHSFLKIPCDPLVSNKLENGKIAKRPKETPLKSPSMNFSRQADKTTKTNNKKEMPLELPKIW